MLDKHVQLLLEDGFDLSFALAAQVGGGLGDAPCHQSTPLVGHLPGQVAGGFVDLLSLWSRKPKQRLNPPSQVQTSASVARCRGGGRRFPFLSLPMSDCEAWEQLRPWAHREARTVASVRQLVVAGVEGERLHDVRAGPQELSVQLAHCNADAQLGIRHFPGVGRVDLIAFTRLLLPASGCSAAASGVHGPAFT